MTTTTPTTIADLTYITREDLSTRLLSTSTPSPTSSSPIAIIDVRDSDHIGGHIRGSTWIPSSELDYRIPELVRELKGKETVVFHCALSQQRGPSAALRYVREKERLEGKSEGGKDGDGEKGKEGEQKEQKVLVLDGGFTKWQEKYGEDGRLTEAYQKDIWEFGY
ncbi:Cdc25 family phosphatase-like protein Ibp1 [Dendryphion nanum]|uniref:Cdc25 family phosphatase-like protein Ibp1 n=1 Tax=Dendryphion nanum TaxID=256645 RepID=A0A9P9DL85_9PLEO|nr:Cdc25 family phosphatase-like protein Ibp1 [Dendryphion nanum]